MKTLNSFVRLSVCVIAAMAQLASAAETMPATPDPLLSPKPEALAAWKDMRFGMFICWGPVTLTGKEIGWSRGRETPVEEYDSLYKKWNPDKFDAREWVKLAKDAGCGYIIFLLKHHDGFCLWDTKQTDYNVINSPFKRDVVKEIAAACKEFGVGLFPYYSTCDWHHPDFPLTSPGGKVERPTSNLERYTAYLEAQSKELITRYGPLVGIWYDVPQKFDRARGERVIRFVRSLQPGILVNNRTGAPGDFDTPEQRIGAFKNDRPWETCMTITTQWAYKPEDKVKPLEDCVRILVSCAAGDGNLALNTGPLPDGSLDPREVKVFREIGVWLGNYGESIYGTRGGPFVAADVQKVKRAVRGGFELPGGAWWGGSTHKGNTIYLHILRWPAETIVLPPIARRIVGSSVLTGGTAQVKQTEAGIEVRLPAEGRDALDTIVKLELDGPAKDIPVVMPPGAMSGSLAKGKKAAASVFYKQNANYAADKAFDDDLESRWGTNTDTRAAWLEVDLGAAQTFDHVFLSEYSSRVKKFELQVDEGGKWRTAHRGTAIGESCELKFAPVTGQKVRLNLTECDPGPSIYEFQIFAPEKAK